MLCFTVAFLHQLLLVLVLCSQGTERCPSAFCECSDWEDYKITCRDIYFIPSLPEDTQTVFFVKAGKEKESVRTENPSILSWRQGTSDESVESGIKQQLQSLPK